MTNKLFVVLFLLLAPMVAWATHNRAGEITYVQTGPNTIRVTIVTYTKASSTAADRAELELFWGDGTKSTVTRSNGGGNGVVLPGGNDMKYNEYVATHTYPGQANYLLSMLDPNRNADVLNVNPPNSVEIAFYLQTEVRFVDLQFQGSNSSPILLQPPIDVGFVGRVFQHTPNAYDPDGDSIAYELIAPMEAANRPVRNYLNVNQVAPGPNNTYTFDVRTGLFTWNTPQRAGEYNIAMLVKSYRRGVYLGAIVRDMQIIILPNNNRPPVINPLPDLCVFAGEIVNFRVSANDPDNQVLELTATGGPFEFPAGSRATFSTGPARGSVLGDFTWETNCSHIRQQPYQVVFRAVDESGAAAFEIINIRVVGPPPTGVVAQSQTTSVEVCWDAPYVCSSNSLFRGFSIWRKEGCESTPVTCAQGDVGPGFVRLNRALYNVSATSGRYCFSDATARRGTIYSYRVVAHFAPLSSGGFPYNAVLGAASSPACVQVKQDVPLMLNVDVRNTDVSNGEIFVRWTRPKPRELDTLVNPGPYRYVLLRGNGSSGAATAIVTRTYNSFWQAVDTSFFDTGLNTVANSYNYAVEFYALGTTKIGTSFEAASIFVTVTPGDTKNRLTWLSSVPWANYRYRIYRQTLGGAFVLHDSVATAGYTDLGLNNGQEYCYYIESLGNYPPALGMPSPLINKSQRVCASPRDNEPPCPPVVRSRGCDVSDAQTLASELRNRLSWDVPSRACDADVASYNIYFSPTSRGTYTLVGTINRSAAVADTFTFLHQPSVGSLIGCYYVKAVDSVEALVGGIPSGGNEGLASDTICFTNCPLYPDLPNVFTPNGDGDNDFFTPFAILNNGTYAPFIRHIAKVEFKVFNRWGQLVFETEDPMLNWNGKENNTGQMLADGAYFYTCKIYEAQADGPKLIDKVLKGYVQIVGGR